jgi:cyclic beta-1,2-glucan synthetase
VCQAGEAQLMELQRKLEGSTDLHDLACQIQEARTWCARLADNLKIGAANAAALQSDLQTLDQQCQHYFREMDFRFLFDEKRQLFHLGYNADDKRLDDYHYGDLASEARIVSVLAIAKGDVPQSHWLHLSRTLTWINGSPALTSWKGGLFEYLMPCLLVRNYEGTLLEQSCRVVINCHITHCSQRDVPWGISESGYYYFDGAMNYQYTGFGVPALASKRVLSEDLVIAPYASILALSLAPREVVQNIARLCKLQMLSMFGFYESIDFSPARLVPNQTHAIVYSLMTHHQGMIFLSLVNYLQDHPMVYRFHADPRVQSVETLLQI